MTIAPPQLGRGILGHATRASTKFPLKVATGKRHLIDQNGAPFLALGEGVWYPATKAAFSDVQTYLADRVPRGFNTFLILAIDNVETSNGTGANVNGHMPFNSKQGGGSYTNSTTQSPDFSTPNSAYWSDLDAVLNLFASYGAVVMLYPIWIGNPIGDPTDEGYYNALAATSSGTRQAYGAFVAGRYGAGGTNPIPGLIWGIGGDNDVANGSSITAINNDVANGILSVDSNALMFADGLDGSSMVDAWHAQAWFTVNGVYSDEAIGHSWAYAQCSHEYQNSNGTYAQFWKEGCYENAPIGSPASAQFVRSQYWQSMLGGCWGFCFGHYPLFNFDSGWQSLLNSRGALDCQVGNTFFYARRWDLLVPDWSDAFLTNGASYTNANFASAALASDGSWGAVYVPSNESLTIALSSFSAPTVVATWVDPTTGGTMQIGSFDSIGSHSFTPPATNAQGDADWILVFG